MDLPVQKWAYVAVDAANSQGRLGGPAAAALSQYDRVLGYGRWGAGILKETLGRDIPYLPHGVSLATYTTPASEAEQAWVKEAIGPFRKQKDRLLGCVMTNQFRKDLGMYFQLLAELTVRGEAVYGWLHTDQAVKAWALQELVSTLGLHKRVTVSLVEYTDRQLALLYQACDVTVLPSLGEGFGYPIVESLASGTPCVHSGCAGGAELVPKTEWRVPVRLERLEGIYALRRPVLQAEDWANAVQRAWAWTEKVGETVSREYCFGAVEHLGWQHLWPRWYAWLKAGL
jgi:glycosyltransferase involved in cell wall biosynthesis